MAHTLEVGPYEPGEWPPWLGSCEVCADVETHLARTWWPCEHPERPLDLHGVFNRGDECCDRAWNALRLPRHDLPVLV